MITDRLEGTGWILKSQHIDLIPGRYPSRSCRVNTYWHGLVHLVFDTNEDMLIFASELSEVFELRDFPHKDVALNAALSRNAVEFFTSIAEHWRNDSTRRKG